MFIEIVGTGLVLVALVWVLLNIVCSIGLFLLAIVAQFFRDPDGGRRIEHFTDDNAC